MNHLILGLIVGFLPIGLPALLELSVQLAADFVAMFKKERFTPAEPGANYVRIFTGTWQI